MESNNKNRCFQEIFYYKFVDDELDPADRDKVRDHLEACAKCRELVVAIAAENTAIKELFEIETTMPDLTGIVMNRLNNEPSGLRRPGGAFEKPHCVGKRLGYGTRFGNIPTAYEEPGRDSEGALAEGPGPPQNFCLDQGEKKFFLFSRKWLPLAAVFVLAAFLFIFLFTGAPGEEEPRESGVLLHSARVEGKAASPHIFESKDPDVKFIWLEK